MLLFSNLHWHRVAKIFRLSVWSLKDGKFLKNHSRSLFHPHATHQTTEGCAGWTIITISWKPLFPNSALIRTTINNRHMVVSAPCPVMAFCNICGEMCLLAEFKIHTVGYVSLGGCVNDPSQRCLTRRSTLTKRYFLQKNPLFFLFLPDMRMWGT